MREARNRRREAPIPRSFYLQNGQQPPFAATFVAAAAVTPKTLSSIAINPTSLAFIRVSFHRRAAIALFFDGKPSGRLECQGLDLQVGLKVLS
jgi:hypothetical protein